MTEIPFATLAGGFNQDLPSNSVSGSMIRRIYNSIRADLGGFALALGSLGFFAFVLLIPLALLSANFWTGFSPDGPGMAGAERNAVISERLAADARYRFAPLFIGSVVLLGYGFYEAYVEQKRKRVSAHAY